MATSIKKLLEQIEEKEIVLPEFQREFTWNRDQVRSLFESFYKRYPTGSLLFWETSNPPKIKQDAYDLEKIRRVKVLLDGQQRLTSLYFHIKNSIPPYYTSEEINNNYFDLYFNLKTGIFRYYKKLEMKDDPLWIKLSDIFQDAPSVFTLIPKLKISDPIEREKTAKTIEKNIRTIEQIKEIEYPIQTVPSEAKVREAIKVFDLINSQGTPLTQSDIVLAYLTAEWPDVRRIFKDKLAELKRSNFTFDLTFLTRCMVGITDGVGDLARFGEPNETDLRNAWKSLDKTLNYLIPFLQNKAYIVGDEDLNTTNVLVPIVVYLSKYGWFTQETERKFIHWLYAALYQRHFSGSVDSTLDKDIRALLDEPEPESLLTNLKEEEGDPQLSAASLDMRGVGNPLYNMMSIVIRARGAVDWANGLPLITTNSADFSIERHHIFPKSVLKKAGWDTGESQYDSKRVHELANRIPLTKSGNLDIFDQPPSEYLPIVEEKYPGNLEKSLVPKNPNLWKIENYEEFLAQRRRLIAEAINIYMKDLLENNTNQSNINLKSLIQEGESERIEFKAVFHGGSADYRLETAVVKSIAGMLNKVGGCLLIGIDDAGEIKGLEKDYTHQRKQNRDGFIIELTNEIAGKLGASCLPLIQIDFVHENNHDVCIVKIDQSSKPIFMQEDGQEKFYVRFHNSTRPLPHSDASVYIREHFK